MLISQREPAEYRRRNERQPSGRMEKKKEDIAMKRWKRMLAGGLCTAMAIALAGCGESGSADADVSISMWIFSSMDGEDYTEYEENPVVQYTLEKTWGPENKTEILWIFRIM